MPTSWFQWPHGKIRTKWFGACDRLRTPVARSCNGDPRLSEIRSQILRKVPCCASLEVQNCWRVLFTPGGGSMTVGSLCRLIPLVDLFQFLEQHLVGEE